MPTALPSLFAPHGALTRYTATAMLLHWVTAVLISGLLALGLYMEGLPFSPEKLELYSWHKWAGVTAFVLVIARVAWRSRHRPPPLPGAMSVPLRIAAHAAHLLLYVLMLAIPLTGWLMSSAKGVSTVWFGVLPIPDLLDRNDALGDLLQIGHKYLNWLFIAVLCTHVGAALAHHFIIRDDVLVRMLPAPTKDWRS